MRSGGTLKCATLRDISGRLPACGALYDAPTRLIRPAPEDDRRDGLEQDAHVEEDRPPLEVKEVEPDEVVEVEVRAAGDLPQPGDAGHHQVALLVPVLQALEVALGQR